MIVDKNNFAFSKLEEIAKVRSLTEDERAAYDVSLRKYRDTKAVINMQRKEEKIAIATNLKRMGMPSEPLSIVTGLSVREIEKLASKADD